LKADHGAGQNAESLSSSVGTIGMHELVVGSLHALLYFLLLLPPEVADKAQNNPPASWNVESRLDLGCKPDNA
jgi:hypothetical protein